MKKTLVLGLSTAIVMTSLAGCTFNKPMGTLYGAEPQDTPEINQNIDEPVPDVYGAEVPSAESSIED